MRAIVAAAAAVLFVLTGCLPHLAPTPYQPMGRSGGFEETKLSPNSWRVNFAGNAATGTARAEDFVLLRSAEIALQNGFRYFVIADQASRSEISTFTTGGTTQTYPNTYGTPTTYRAPVQVHDVNKPVTETVIVCFNEKPDTDLTVYDAEFLKKSIGAKYGL